MSAESILYTVLNSAGGITALVGDRIYPTKMPQGKPTPAIVYMRTDTEFVMTIHNSVPSAELVEIDICALAMTDAEAGSVGNAIQAALAVAHLIPTGRRVELFEETDLQACIISCRVKA